MEATSLNPRGRTQIHPRHEEVVAAYLATSRGRAGRQAPVLRTHTARESVRSPTFRWMLIRRPGIRFTSLTTDQQDGTWSAGRAPRPQRGPPLPLFTTNTRLSMESRISAMSIRRYTARDHLLRPTRPITMSLQATTS